VVEVAPLPAHVLMLLATLLEAFRRRWLPFFLRDTRICAFFNSRSALR
jgi:hypothetical protein